MPTPRPGPTPTRNCKAPQRGIDYQLYVIIDIYSRYVVGWTVASTKTGELAKEFIADTLAHHGIQPDQLVLHADSETVLAGVPGVPDPHSDGHDRIAGAGCSQGFLTLTPIDEALSFLGSVGALGASGEALRLAVGVT
jgi:hypothetical protein